MFLLFETAAGYAVFKTRVYSGFTYAELPGGLLAVDLVEARVCRRIKVSDSLEAVKPAEIWKYFESSVKAKQVYVLLSIIASFGASSVGNLIFRVDLVCFKKFKNMTQALQAGVAMSEGALGKPLKTLMKALVKNNIESLAVNNPKLGALIKNKFQVNCVADGRVAELMRGIRKQLNSLIEEEVEARELAAMTLGLAHSLCRYKLKFSSDQADTMVIQAVGLLDELDKEINGYIMRLREWYGWHFPELGKMLTDNMTYVKVVSRVGKPPPALGKFVMTLWKWALIDYSYNWTRMRQGFKAKRLKSLLSEEDIAEVQDLALHSVGSEITNEDSDRIKELCTQIIELDSYRDSLNEYMRVRMASLAPNMTALVGEVMAARLIARSGSLLNLAKSASSTVQILGAEKALFRALKSKRDTPKYGLIYHAQLIGSAPQNLKGKMARMLAAKLSLSARVDAFSERPVVDTSMALGHRANLEQKLKTMENVAAFSQLPASGKTPKQCSSWAPKVESSGYDKTAVLHERKRLIQEIESPLVGGKKKMKHDEGLAAPATPAESAKVVSVKEEESEYVPEKKSKRADVSSSAEIVSPRKGSEDVSTGLQEMPIPEEGVVYSSFHEDEALRKKQRRAKRKAAAMEKLKASESATTVESHETSSQLFESTLSGELPIGFVETTMEESSIGFCFLPKLF
ncbi:snoRNA binding domain protein, partial [Trichuris suis]